jgi:hypothetical protein
MFTKLREPFGKAGLTVAILALVMALVGGAYAAGGLTKSQEKQVTKIAKKYAGKPGAQGPAGPQGNPGSAGAVGKDGTNGTNGTNGTSATTATIPTSSATCSHNGGVEVKSASAPLPVCNGTTGFTETLPSGKTLQGDWNIYQSVEGGFVATSVSFGIPLSEAPTAVYIRAGDPTPEHCAGDAKEPGADNGFLCVFAVTEENIKPAFGTIQMPAVLSVSTAGVPGGSALAVGHGDPFGFGVEAIAEEPGTVDLSGTWAVTAE